MKSFKDLNIQDEYRTFTTNIVREFLVPVLSCSVLYQRAVGFFSSSSMIQLLDGLQSLVRNNGKIHLIVSPKLNEKDIEAISKGYISREVAIEESMLEIIEDLQNKGHEKRLILLSKLIEQGYVDIKIAFLHKGNNIGMFHEKLGIMTDSKGNYLAFSGSLNESETAYSFNYESFDVFKSWEENESKKAQNKKEVFEKMWANTEKGINVIEFSKVAQEKLQRISQDYIIRNGDFDIEEGFAIGESLINSNGNDLPKLPKDLEIRDYQQVAIDNWKLNDFTGIFDMATGSGKTITGIYGLTVLFNLMHRLPVIIVAPYTHLVEQWVEDLEWFNIKPIVGYSHSQYRNYKKRLKDKLISYEYGGTDFICFITTNASFRTTSVKELINLFPDDTLIVIDEAHNFGSKRLEVTLPTRFKYRMALSATIDRHNDVEGTEFLYSYFGTKVIEYTLERAISEDKLSKYKYYPITTYLSDEEYYDYRKLSLEISKHLKEVNGRIKITDIGKLLLLKRSRIVAGAKDKIVKLIEVMASYKNETSILIYSGATNLVDESIPEDEIRMIDVISKNLYDRYEFISSQFTSNEDKDTRKRIIQYFVNKEVQAIVAIKCLDEGVNIPSIKTAFILASSTNPKEYVQRRGRVLRKHKDKNYSEIFDFIVLPPKNTNPFILSEEGNLLDYGLIKRELTRVYEFMRLSMNSNLGYEYIKSTLKDYPKLSFGDLDISTKKEHIDDII